jgi:unsaturated rhamnogalacturonyl hydrolase
MYAYTIVKGLQLNILNKKKYFPMVEKSYQGLRNLSMRNPSGAYLIPTRVSGGTCVGDKEYYLNRKIGEGTGFGYGSFIMFGLAYEKYTGLRK